MKSEPETQTATSCPVLCMKQVEKLVLADIFVPNPFLCSVFILTEALAVISQRNSCIPAPHPALSWELEGPTRILGIFLACFARGLAVYSMTVSRQHVAPSASSQPPRLLPKSQCPSSSLFAQPFALYLFSPSPILLPFLPDLCQKGKETRFLSPSKIPVIDAAKIILKMKMHIAHAFQILSSTGSM